MTVKNYRTDRASVFVRKVRIDDQTGTAVDLSAYTARLQIRRTVSSATPLVAVTSTDASLTLNASGIVEMSLTVAQVALLGDENWYDLELIDSAGRVFRPLRGKLYVFSDKHDTYGSVLQ